MREDCRTKNVKGTAFFQWYNYHGLYPFFEKVVISHVATAVKIKPSLIKYFRNIDDMNAYGILFSPKKKSLRDWSSLLSLHILKFDKTEIDNFTIVYNFE